MNSLRLNGIRFPTSQVEWQDIELARISLADRKAARAHGQQAMASVRRGPGKPSWGLGFKCEGAEGPLARLRGLMADGVTVGLRLGFRSLLP
jgi:hypothetical protein